MTKNVHLSSYFWSGKVTLCCVHATNLFICDRFLKKSALLWGTSTVRNNTNISLGSWFMSKATGLGWRLCTLRVSQLFPCIFCVSEGQGQWSMLWHVAMQNVLIFLAFFRRVPAQILLTQHGNQLLHERGLCSSLLAWIHFKLPIYSRLRPILDGDKQYVDDVSFCMSP